MSMTPATENYFIPLTSNQTRCDEATFSVGNVQCGRNVLGHSFRVQKKKPSGFHLHPWLQRVLFLFMQIPQPAPDQEKEIFFSDDALWVSANAILRIFQRSLFSLKMSPSVALSLFILFFTGLILNAGIREASKSGREADVWWGRHRWNHAHFSAGQPTSFLSTCFSELPLPLLLLLLRGKHGKWAYYPTRGYSE